MILNINSIKKAADLISLADNFLIIVGAGMGVDSGLPDFRGNKGFWKVHPNFKSEKLSFSDLANPHWFFDNPKRAWGFYGHRHQLYSKTFPHEGFNILKTWCDLKQENSFIYTSNVDGHFQKAGFPQKIIYECHGSINYFQCNLNCSEDIWHNPDLSLEIDENNLLAKDPLPNCKNCGAIARPNILMFDDYNWIEERALNQRNFYKKWLDTIEPESTVIIEIGAGVSGCSARNETKRNRKMSNIIRINPTDAKGNDKTVSIKMNELDTLLAINKELLALRK